MRIGILGSGLMGSKLGMIMARRTRLALVFPASFTLQWSRLSVSISSSAHDDCTQNTSHGERGGGRLRNGSSIYDSCKM